MIDIVIKISQKFCPGSLYKILGRLIGSHSYFNEDTYMQITEGYLKAIGGNALQGAYVMEIGPGDQIVTAVQFLRNGARKVICVDPKMDSKKNSGEQIVVETDSFDYQIARKYIGAIDVLLSYQVLEHVEDLNNIFKCIWLVLKRGGIFYSKVDLSDHSYHSLGKLMQKFGIDIEKFRGKYLEYSDTSFKLINPNRKIPMNRRILPEYLQLLDYYGFEWELDERILYHSNKINPMILEKIPSQFSHYSAAYWFGIKAKKH